MSTQTQKPYRKDKVGQAPTGLRPEANCDLRVVTVYSVTVDGRRLLTGESVPVWELVGGRWQRTAKGVRVNVLRFSCATEVGSHELHVPVMGTWKKAAALRENGELGTIPVSSVSPDQNRNLRFDCVQLRPSSFLGLIGGVGCAAAMPYPKWDAAAQMMRTVLAAKLAAPEEPASSFAPESDDNLICILPEGDLEDDAQKQALHSAVAARLATAGATTLSLHIPAVGKIGTGERLPGWVTSSTAASDAAFAAGFDNRDEILGKTAAW